jgi:hypothetical protein
VFGGAWHPLLDLCEAFMMILTSSREENLKKTLKIWKSNRLKLEEFLENQSKISLKPRPTKKAIFKQSKLDLDTL